MENHQTNNYYEISVSRSRVHLFSTAPHSAPHLHNAGRIFVVLRDRFPESEGYEVTVAYHTVDVIRYSPVNFQRKLDEAAGAP